MPKNQSAPKYIHIKEQLLAGIASSRFTRMLPSENRLAQMFGISRMTARVTQASTTRKTRFGRYSSDETAIRWSALVK